MSTVNICRGPREEESAIERGGVMLYCTVEVLVECVWSAYVLVAAKVGIGSSSAMDRGSNLHNGDWA